MGRNILSGESVLFHDLLSASSARHPRACCQRRSQEKAGPDEGLGEKIILSPPSAPWWSSLEEVTACRQPARHRGWLTGAAGTSVQVGRERLILGTEPGGPPILLSDDLSSDWDPWSLGIRELIGVVGIEVQIPHLYGKWSER